MAAELTDGHIRETGIALTPVADGRFEVYVNDEKIYDRKEAGDGDFLTSLKALRVVKTKLIEELEAAPVSA